MSWFCSSYNNDNHFHKTAWEACFWLTLVSWPMQYLIKAGSIATIHFKPVKRHENMSKCSFSFLASSSISGGWLLSDYNVCPQKFCGSVKVRIPEPGPAAMSKGRPMALTAVITEHRVLPPYELSLSPFSVSHSSTPWTLWWSHSFSLVNAPKIERSSAHWTFI